MDDHSFVNRVADRLAALPGVDAVSLGGSRASGTNGPTSDWDFALYYRDRFNPADLRALGWEGTISEIGGWGGGIFSGGAWLEIEGRRADVHYRDLNVAEHELAQARHGRFHIEPLMFHLAGMPRYLVVAELAVNRVLRGKMPRPEYPSALRHATPPVWRDRADQTLNYARGAFVDAGKVTELAKGSTRPSPALLGSPLTGSLKKVLANPGWLRAWLERAKAERGCEPWRQHACHPLAASRGGRPCGRRCAQQSNISC
jgi:predicted nucleotidyltransferase